MEALTEIKQILTEHSVAWVQTDKQGRIVSVNEHFISLCGYSLDEIQGRKPKDFLHGPQTEDGPRDMLSGYLRNHLPISTELTNYRKNQEPYEVHLSIFPLLETPGDPNSLRGFFALEFDITGQETLALKHRKILFQTAKKILQSKPREERSGHLPFSNS